MQLSITEYRQRKKLNSDKPDENETENDSLGIDDNNSSESFKATEQAATCSSKATTMSRSSSRSSSCSSLEVECKPAPIDFVKTGPAFNSEPTELERQREITSLRLKKAFGLVDDDTRKASGKDR